MISKVKFRKKIYNLFLFFIILIFYGFYGSHLVFANPLTVIDSLKQDRIINADLDNNKVAKCAVTLTPCRGVNSAHTKKKVVALTFDDGPHKKYTDEILWILKIYNIKATFFFIGKNAQEYPDMVKAVYSEGHVIGNHSYSHRKLPCLPGDEIELELTKTSNIINEIIDVYPILFRPPYGACSPKTIRVSKALGFKTIMWSAMVDDYHVDRTTADKIATEILSLVKPGTIIGLHDGGGNREKTVEALLIIIRDLKNKGYEFLTIPEMFSINAYEANTTRSG